LFEVRQHREYREFQPTQNLSMAGLETSYGSHLYAEPIPLEEEEAGELDRAIVVVHFQKEFTRLHGVPIKFVVKPVRPRACVLSLFLDSGGLTRRSANCGTMRRNGCRRGWDLKKRTLPKSRHPSSPIPLTIRNSRQLKMVPRFPLLCPFFVASTRPVGLTNSWQRKFYTIAWGISLQGQCSHWTTQTERQAEKPASKPKLCRSRASASGNSRMEGITQA
jgi:Ubiquitin-specific protease C-terminal